MTLQNKDTALFGTKAKNIHTDELCIILYTWIHSTWACGGRVAIPYATYVDIDGNKNNTPFDNLTII